MNNNFENNETNHFEENEYLEYVFDSTQLAQEYQLNIVSDAVVAADQADKLTDMVEYWKWMQRNFSKSGIFDSPQAMQIYLNSDPNKEGWLRKQLQGKGYEWDWIQTQRRNIRNVCNQYYAGDISNRPSSDVTQTNLFFTGEITENQMKAYTSGQTPHLENTSKDATNMKIVANEEVVDKIKAKGYSNVESFQDSETINQNVEKRINQIKDGTATPLYNLRNVVATMFYTGLTGVVISASIEGFSKWKEYKSGFLSKEEYMMEIANAAGEGGVIGASTAGIMIPVSSMLTKVGLASLPITIPVAVLVSGALSKIIAPVFKRGEYRKNLLEAKYYQSIAHMTDALVFSLKDMQEQYSLFVSENYENTNIQSYLNATNTDIKHKIEVLDSFIDDSIIADKIKLMEIEDIIDKI